MKFKHREHVITVRRDGSFMAEGGNVQGSSLEVVKRKLDEKYNRKPFKALRWCCGWPNTSVEVVTVVGMKRHQRWGTSKTEFVLNTGLAVSELFENTAENKRLLRAAATLKRKHQKIRIQHERQQTELMSKVTRAKAE